MASSVVAASSFGVKPVSAQNENDQSNNTEYGEVQFDRNQSVGWINERFIEYDSPDNPTVGTELSFTAMVLTNLQSEEERLQTANEFQWKNFEFGGKRILGKLFKPISWVLDPVQDLTESFYEKFELMKLAGVTEDDQQFFDRYEHVPQVWAVGDAETFYPSGTILDLTATVRYADQDSEPMSPGTGNGFYIEVSEAEPIDDIQTLDADTNIGETATFTGLQYIDQPTLSNYLTEVDYEYGSGSEFPKPEGGALVKQTGEVIQSSFNIKNLVRDNSAKLRVTDQQVIVGSTHYQAWDKEDNPAETEPNTKERENSAVETDDTAVVPNIVAVVDASGSMDEIDTQSGQERLQVAKENLTALINYVEQGNRFGLVSFSENASIESNLKRMNTDGIRTEFEQAVSDISTRNATSIGAGLSKAVDLLDGAQGPKSIVLLSDGEENRAPMVSEILPDINRFGINIYTIGIGSGADKEQLEYLANETSGEFAFAPEASEIRALYQQFSIGAQDRSTLTSKTVSVENDDTVEGTAKVDQSCSDAQFALSHDTDSASIELENPDGKTVKRQENVTQRTGENFEVWTVQGPKPGEWQYNINVASTVNEGEVTVEVSADSPIDGTLFVSDELFEQTGMVKTQVKMSDQRRRYTGADVSLRAIPVESDGGAMSTSESENGGNQSTNISEEMAPQTEKEILLSDDGKGSDAVGNDGIYTSFVPLSKPGKYKFEAVVTGGKIGELTREMKESITIENEPRVNTPIQPYLEDETVLDTIGKYAGPGGVAFALLAVLIGALRTMKKEE